MLGQARMLLDRKLNGVEIRPLRRNGDAGAIALPSPGPDPDIPIGVNHPAGTKPNNSFALVALPATPIQ